MRRHGAEIGTRETMDVARAFLDTSKPRIPLQAHHPHRGREPISTAAVKGAAP